jgi:hypothetical protein
VKHSHAHSHTVGHPAGIPGHRWPVTHVHEHGHAREPGSLHGVHRHSEADEKGLTALARREWKDAANAR